MRLTVRYNEETGLLDIVSSGGNLAVSQTEAAALYMILRKGFGLRGRLNLWLHRKEFRTIAE